MAAGMLIGALSGTFLSTQMTIVAIVVCTTAGYLIASGLFRR
jgi:hypothetical protein